VAGHPILTTGGGRPSQLRTGGWHRHPMGQLGVTEPPPRALGVVWPPPKGQIKKTLKAHQSTPLPEPLSETNSGARYSWVPTQDLENAVIGLATNSAPDSSRSSFVGAEPKQLKLMLLVVR
jgi:hypothetical protein